MTTDPINRMSGDVETAAEAVVTDGREAFMDAVASAERRIAEAARKAERVLTDALQTLRSQSKVYAGNANEQLDQAQRYLVERVKLRPVTATLAGLGLGLLLGVLLSGREK